MGTWEDWHKKPHFNFISHRCDSGVVHCSYQKAIVEKELIFPLKEFQQKVVMLLNMNKDVRSASAYFILLIKTIDNGILHFKPI